MNKIAKFIFLDIFKNKTVLFYTLVLSLLSWSVFNLEDNSTKGILTLLNVVLLTVPLVAVIFSTIYLYNSSEFIELLLSQPVSRSKIWKNLFRGLSLSLTASFCIGTGIPLLIYTPFKTGIIMTLGGVFITIIFVSLAFLSVTLTRDKAKGIGLAVMLWLFFALLFDGILLFLVFQLSDYPIEKIMAGISALNPIDLTRILILLQLDVSAMMGYTGAIFKDLFGTVSGMLIVFSILSLWIFIPFRLSLFKFKKKDL